MKYRRILLILAAFLIAAAALPCAAEEPEPFTDESFRGNISTETLDAIIEKYELYDGWYWTTQAGVPQDFHGREGKPGWTDSAVNVFRRTGYIRGWYGYRWGREQVNPEKPNDAGYGECYGFVDFLSYLLTGERSPHPTWKAYANIRLSKGLRPGDIIRADYKKNGRRYQHSAMVYSVEGDEVLFLQVSGGNFNLLRTRQGYCDGNLMFVTSVKQIEWLNGTTIYRYIPEEEKNDG